METLITHVSGRISGADHFCFSSSAFGAATSLKAIQLVSERNNPLLSAEKSIVAVYDMMVCRPGE